MKLLRLLSLLPGVVGLMTGSQRPRFLTYIVTFRCNARCVMCDSWKKPSPGERTLTEIESVFRQLPALDFVRLSVCEPFVRQDLPEITELVRTQLRPHFLHVTSNGFLTQRIVEFCEQRDRRLSLRVLISIDGVGDKHNEIRGRSTAYSAAMATLEALAPRRRELRLSLSVNQTIVDAEGVEHYRRLREILEPMGVRHQAVLAYRESAMYHLQKEINVALRQSSEYALFNGLAEPEVRELVAEVEEDLRRLPWAERWAKGYYWAGIKHRG